MSDFPTVTRVVVIGGGGVGAAIALGKLRADLAVPGSELEIDIYGEMRKAVVQKDDSLWDPKNERLRA